MDRVSKLRYRRLDAQDVPEMHVIERLCFALPWSEASLLEEMDDNPFAWYLGAFCDEDLVGYVGIWKIMDEAHMTNLAVRPDFQRLGIAKKLIRQIKQQALEMGAGSMTLEVRESNIVAQKLYNAAGFSTVGRRKRYYSDNNEDALIMWCHDLHCHDQPIGHCHNNDR